MEDAEALYHNLLDSYASIGEPRSLLAGISGGADSVCLVHLLKKLRCEKGIRLTCVHVNHHLRENAQADEEFVRSLCRLWEIDLLVKQAQVSRAGNLEANARSARYQAFREALEQSGANRLVLAHHMDDQAETLLMRLMRGSGPKGLSAMRADTGGIWRPLLSARRKEIEAYLKEHSISWREDESNADDRYTRNFVRHRLLPLMEERVPAAVSNIVGTSCILSAEEEYWEGFCEDWLSKNASLVPSNLFINLREFDKLHVAACRRLLRGFCAKAGLEPGREQLERLMAISRSAGSRAYENLEDGARVFRSKTRLHLLPERRLSAAMGSLQKTDRSKDGNRRIETFDAEMTEGAQLRFRHPGDFIRPLGMEGRKSLSDYLIDRGMDRPLRDQWPLLAKGQEILWVVGFGMAQTAALTDKTKRRVTLRYQGRLPDETEAEWESALKENGADDE